MWSGLITSSYREPKYLNKATWDSFLTDKGNGYQYLFLSERMYPVGVKTRLLVTKYTTRKERRAQLSAVNLRDYVMARC